MPRNASGVLSHDCSSSHGSGRCTIYAAGIFLSASPHWRKRRLIAGARIRALQGLLPRPLLAVALSAGQPHVVRNRCDPRQWRANRTIVLRRIIVRAGIMFASPTSIFSEGSYTGGFSAAPLSRPSRFLLARSFKANAFATRCQSAWGVFHRLRRAEVTC